MNEERLKLLLMKAINYINYTEGWYCVDENYIEYIQDTLDMTNQEIKELYVSESVV